MAGVGPVIFLAGKQQARRREALMENLKTQTPDGWGTITLYEKKAMVEKRNQGEQFQGSPNDSSGPGRT